MIPVRVLFRPIDDGALCTQDDLCSFRSVTWLLTPSFTTADFNIAVIGHMHLAVCT